VQEALQNVAKHSGQEARVTLRGNGQQIELTIEVPAQASIPRFPNGRKR